MRILALDHGAARCGVAVSDPTGTLATPLGAVERPDTKRGLAALVRLVEHHGAELVLVGLPLTMKGEEGEQAERARTFAERLERRVSVPVELHDERLTTRLAERTGPRPTCSRATLLATGRAHPSEPRTAARAGWPNARAARGCPSGTGSPPSGARGACIDANGPASSYHRRSGPE